MIKKLYGFYRPEYIWNKDLWNISQNGKYTLSFYCNWQYSDYMSSWIIAIKDMEIPTDRYTKEVAPSIKDLREFVYMEYEDTYVDLTLANTIISKIWARFDLELLDTETARQFVRAHTNLEEVETGKFKISDETIWMQWEIIPAKYLIIY